MLPSFSVVLAVLSVELGPFNQVPPKDISCLLMMLIFPQTDAERWWQRIYANEKLNRNLRNLDQGKSLAAVNKPKLYHTCTEMITKQLQDSEGVCLGWFCGTFCQSLYQSKLRMIQWWTNRWNKGNHICSFCGEFLRLYQERRYREREPHTQRLQIKVAYCLKIFFRRFTIQTIQKR